MEHPYKEYENTPIWSIVGQAITELVENNDIELQTPIEYVIGYICKKGRSLKVPWNNPILAKDSTYPIQEEWNISNAM